MNAIAWFKTHAVDLIFPMSFLAFSVFKKDGKIDLGSIVLLQLFAQPIIIVTCRNSTSFKRYNFDQPVYFKIKTFQICRARSKVL